MLNPKSSIHPRARHLLQDDRGLTTVEYVILLVLVAITSVAAWNTFGMGIKARLDASQKSFDANVPTPH